MSRQEAGVPRKNPMAQQIWWDLQQTSHTIPAVQPRLEPGPPALMAKCQENCVTRSKTQCTNLQLPRLLVFMLVAPWLLKFDRPKLSWPCSMSIKYSLQWTYKTNMFIYLPHIRSLPYWWPLSHILCNVDRPLRITMSTLSLTFSLILVTT